MKQIETQIGKPLIQALPDMINQDGLSQTAGTLGVSKATLGYWCLKLGINVKRIAIRQDEIIQIRKII